MTGGAVVLTGAPSDTEETGDAGAGDVPGGTVDRLGLAPGEQAAAMAITRQGPRKRPRRPAGDRDTDMKAGW